jgi:hypothetical protein
MLTLFSVLACALYLLPLVALLALVWRRRWSPIDLAVAMATVFALDFLGTFVLTYLVRVEVAAFVRLGLVLAAIVVAWWVRTRRRQDTAAGVASQISRADLVTMVAAGAVAFLVSFDTSSSYWIWDREWHVPFTSTLRGQKLPFENLYEPGRPFRYHLSGNLFAALLQSSSFVTMHASRALSLSHDIQSALLAAIASLVIRTTTAWPPATSALAGVAPLLAGPIGIRSPEQQSFGAYEGYSDFNNFTLSFRPHCMMSLVLLCGIVATLLRLSSLSRDDTRSRFITVLALFPIVGLEAICDEISTAIVCLAIAVMWTFSPQLLGPRRWHGVVVLAGLALTTLLANVALSGSVGPGGPVSHTTWHAPRLPHFFAPPLPIGLQLEPWKQLFVDAGPVLIPVSVVAYVLLRDRRNPEPMHLLGRFALVTTLFALILFLCFEVNGRTFEGHRFMTAARFTVPLIALMFAPRLPRASLSSFLLLAPIAAGIVITFGYAYHRLPHLGAPAAAKEQYPVNCRAEFGARVGTPTSPTFVDESIWYPYAGCHPIFAPAKNAPGDVVLVGWPDTGRSAYAKMEASFFPRGAPARIVCAREASKRGAVCKDAARVGRCRPTGRSAVTCEIPPDRRSDIRGR